MKTRKTRQKLSESSSPIGLKEPFEQQEPKFQPKGSAIAVSETSDDFDEGCRHCGTTRHLLRKGRRCKYCDRLVQRRRCARRWQLDSPQLLKRCALVCNGMYPPTLQQLERFRANYLRQIDEELKRRRYMEARLQEPVNGLDVEHILRAVADLSSADGSSLFVNTATFLEHTFDPQPRSALYKLLYEIIETRPPRMDYKRLFDGVFSIAMVSVVLNR